MPIVEARKLIRAPAARVFDAISDIERFPDVNPMCVAVKFLTAQREGVGARFVETRVHGKREMQTELEITSWDPPRSVRMVADSHGTVWDTLFTVTDKGEGTAELHLEMDCRAHSLLPRLLNPLMKGLFRKGLVQHVDAVAAHLERTPDA